MADVIFGEKTRRNFLYSATAAMAASGSTIAFGSEKILRAQFFSSNQLSAADLDQVQSKAIEQPTCRRALTGLVEKREFGARIHAEITAAYLLEAAAASPVSPVNATTRHESRGVLALFFDSDSGRDSKWF
jgi:hypothetical protein